MDIAVTLGKDEFIRRIENGLRSLKQ